jgi:hypothetical protein
MDGQLRLLGANSQRYVQRAAPATFSSRTRSSNSIPPLQRLHSMQSVTESADVYLLGVHMGCTSLQCSPRVPGRRTGVARPVDVDKVGGVDADVFALDLDDVGWQWREASLTRRRGPRFGVAGDSKALADWTRTGLTLGGAPLSPLSLLLRG